METKVYVLVCSYTEEDTRFNNVMGTYSTIELAERAAQQFIDLADTDDEPISRSTAIHPTTLDFGWYENHYV